MGLLRYRIDTVSILTVFIGVGLQVYALVAEWPWYMIILILPLMRAVTLVEHNHAHLSIFRSGLLNEALGWLCFLSNGIPLEFYRIHHVSNHHRYNQRYEESGKDWSSTFAFEGTRYPDLPVGKAYYVLTFPVITISACMTRLLYSRGSKPLKRFMASATVHILSSATLILINLQGFVIFFVLPWLINIFAHGYNNYDQHCGCSMTDPYNSANESLTILSRWLGFNIGYHIEHHIRPSLHWSKLPQYHREICESIPIERFAGKPCDHRRVKV